MNNTGNKAKAEIMRPQTISFALVLVTYGSRANLVRRAVDKALEHPAVIKIIIVDNDSMYGLDLSHYDDEQRERIEIIRQHINTGSAGGYNVGISFARNIAEADYIILIDDDLILCSNTLEQLSGVIASSNGQEAFVIPRSDRLDQTKSLYSGYSPRIIKNSFSDFHILRLFRTRRQSASLMFGSVNGLSVDYAPYAGMVLSRSLISRSELPDKEFFVYCDDYDFVMKLKKAGAKVILIDVPPLKSIDRSWNQKSGRAPAMFNPEAPAFRVYYSLRNRVAFELRHFVSSKTLYAVNMVMFLAIGSLVSLIESRGNLSLFRRLRLLGTAINDGVKGRLGQDVDTVERYSK
jgi:GT2 family glycosyltransferase